MKHSYFLLLALALASPALHAQCPAGIPSANNAFCLPPDDPRFSGGGANGQSSQSHGTAKTWGAVSFDPGTLNGVGVVGRLDKERAKRSALKGCIENGGTRCEVIDVSKGKCISVATPSPTPQQVFVETAGKVEDAVRKAAAACQKANGGAQCGIVFAECSGKMRY